MPDLPTLSPQPAVATTAESLCQAWYQAYGREIYRYVRFQLPTADQAEDVTADTFLKAFQAAERFDPAKGQPRTWLYRIAQNTLRDHLRRSRIRNHLSMGAMRDLVSEAPSPEERLLWEEEVAFLLASLSALGPRDREIISLRFGSGLETAEVATILGIKESAVRTRLWRSIDRLRAIMVEEGER